MNLIRRLGYLYAKHVLFPWQHGVFDWCNEKQAQWETRVAWAQAEAQAQQQEQTQHIH